MRSAGDSTSRPAAELAAAAERLAAAGCDTPRLDAELLLCHVLRIDRARLLIDDPDLGHGQREAFAALVGRRAAREPVAYIVGRRGFRRIELAVDPRVLIPRPETELLAEVGLELPTAARVADVGTGSGAVALALADERPDLRVLATDSSEAALEVARANASQLGLDVEFRHGDLLAGIEPADLDAVLSNPPYVADGDPRVTPDVALHEPVVALYAGADGLDVVRRLVAAAAGVPLLALEIGAGQAAEVAGLLRAAGREVELRRDLAGVLRVAIGRAR